jgi:hypothetical protein
MIDAAWIAAQAVLPPGWYVESLSYSRAHGNWSARIKAPDLKPQRKLMVHGTDSTLASALWAIVAAAKESTG